MIGRFLSEDPMGFAGSGTNLYAYTGDDPLDFVDPMGLDRGPNNAPNNARNCTPTPASASQYAAATAEMALLTAQFLSGLGPSGQVFQTDSATSQVMAQSAQVQNVLNAYYMVGQTSGEEGFGSVGAATAGGNPVAQFVGSFAWTIAPGNGGVYLQLTNRTSFRSLTYDEGPAWQRFPIVTPNGTFTSPMGTH